ncbi:hypothetical protein [uncultured Devosia sp.]|uniref:hypothetical protein n=1 Tax=uncultured Devosia sp. TaxID=211434 RepID=UPI0035CBCF04
MTAIAVAGAMVALNMSSAAALDRRVRINNNTDYDIVQFYASNKGTDSWEEDILGEDILPAGNSVLINIDDGSGYCKFDFLAVFEDDDQLVTRDNNVCELTDFNFNP